MAVSASQGASYLGLLLWLKLKLVWRAYTRHMSAALGAIFAVIVFTPMAAGAAIGCWAGFHLLAPRMAEHLLRGVLLAAYLFWLMSPILGYVLTEDYDIAKLLVYPLSPRMIYAGAILGSVVDLGVLLLLPTMVVIVASFTTGASAFLIVALAVVLFLFHTVGLTQAINLATAGILRSRRGRDVLAITIPLLMSVFFLISQTVPHAAAGFQWSRIVQSRTWDLISYLPPGLAARAVGSASRGEFGHSLASLLLLAAASAFTLYLAGWLVQLVYTGEAGSPAVRGRPERQPSSAPSELATPRHASPSLLRSCLRRVPPAAAAVADKEFKYLLRDPFFKATLSQTVYMLVVIGVMMFQMGRIDHDEGVAVASSGWFLWGATGMLLLTQSQLALNSFGPEGAAAATLFLFPSPRRHILIGKNLVLLAALAVVNSVFVLAVCVLAGQAPLIPQVLLWTALASVVFVACGNIVSVYFPVRVAMRGWVIRRSSSIGFAQLAAYFVVTLLVGLLMVPVLAAVVVPTYWIRPLWLAITIPLSVGYVCILYVASLLYAERALLERESDVVEKLKQEG